MPDDAAREAVLSDGADTLFLDFATATDVLSHISLTQGVSAGAIRVKRTLGTFRSWRWAGAILVQKRQAAEGPVLGAESDASNMVLPFSDRACVGRYFVR